eukprot:CAMPEP_0197319042 /NCGR_PEP_ID=MMETSP0891-20130614/53177_1 /TAXON_ID=44058 ORGANISM="Aureoumbra lagunensis, Strain CCMP1510" /NCGR_SAMPLE_ID=MMETSP0891 /ASSEMBLY_ACC=CAM_ASM_000534 /LENGTH=489 /DNA_ID=CAMNT_0042809765 /DNA_START=173 /DNA_END=1642 /DNA_ORIENTATION=-
MIGGKMLPSKSKEILPVINPATGQILRYVPESTEDELEAAVHSAREAFSMWRDTSVSKRSRVMFEYQRLIREREDELVQAIVEENGKTIADAKGDVFRGLEVVEQCCALGNHMMGETLANAAIGIDTYSYKEPLGICAGIAPFNFPAMIPLWMFPVGITCGNTYILKPSEKVPSATMILAEMALQAGLPPGVLNVVHGTKPVVDFLCRAPEIKAISFVGGNKAGEYIFAEATRHGKRCQANLGAKNHGVILPDADKEKTLDALVAASMGAAGQRCMALSVAVFVGNSSEWIPELAQRCARLKVGDGADPNSDVGPMISPESKSRAVNLIGQALNKGAKIELDGRNYSGNFLGPTVLSQVSTDSPAYLHELFAPVLSCTCVETLDEAIALVNANPTGNGTAIFTNSGASARLFQREIDVGQVGINVPIPVPLPFFSFTGSRASIRGDLHFYGKQGVTFYTQTKTITSNWRTLHHDESPSKSPSTAMPIMK